MNRAKLALALALVAVQAAVLAAAVPAAAETTVYSIDPAHTSIGFSVRHFLTRVPGRFDEFDGTIQYDPANPTASKVEFTVDAASIDTRNSDRDNHLRSPDFFDVEKHPTLTFKSKSVKAAGADTLEVTGDLTLHGVTKEVTVPVEVLGVMGKKAGFATEFTLDRKEYGIVWNRTLDQGGTLLGDDVKVSIAVEANVQEPEAK